MYGSCSQIAQQEVSFIDDLKGTFLTNPIDPWEYLSVEMRVECHQIWGENGLHFFFGRLDEFGHAYSSFCPYFTTTTTASSSRPCVGVQHLSDDSIYI
jgi:hypothetical protein